MLSQRKLHEAAVVVFAYLLRIIDRIVQLNIVKGNLIHSVQEK